MTIDRSSTTALVMALCLIAVAAFVPVFAAGRPANQIPVTESTAGDAFANPTADAWNDVSAVDIPLSSAPSGVPDADDTAVSELAVQAVHTEERIYLRLSWPDDSKEDAITGPLMFADAAAIQLPANTSTHPGIAMGSQRTPVNVWYWNADSGIEELLAGGPGTTTQFEEPAVETQPTYADGEWHMVFSRQLAPSDENRTTIAMDRDVDVAFAVWDGGNMERSGRKAVSEWHFLALGPGPQGPPYEGLLWGIAGLAVLVVLLVTALAVRRS